MLKPTGLPKILSVHSRSLQKRCHPQDS